MKNEALEEAMPLGIICRSDTPILCIARKVQDRKEPLVDQFPNLIATSHSRALETVTKLRINQIR